MKTLQNNFTTPEQSKLLLELGVPADSADCYYETFDSHDPSDFRLEVRQNPKEASIRLFKEYPRLTPCWSVGRLIDIILKVPGFPYVGPEKCINLTNRNISRIIDLIIETIEVNLDDIDFSKLEE